MIRRCIEYIPKLTVEQVKLTLIDTLLQVTEGKIFVECERARLTRLLADKKEAEGKIVEAADLLQELQVPQSCP